jgi:hypothetical protein
MNGAIPERNKEKINLLSEVVEMQKDILINVMAHR